MKTITLTEAQLEAVLSAVDAYEPDRCPCDGQELESEGFFHYGWEPDELRDLQEGVEALSNASTSA